MTLSAMTGGMKKKGAFHTCKSQTYFTIKAVQKNCGGFVPRAPSEPKEADAEDKDLIEQRARPGL